MTENPMADQNLKPELFELNNGTMRVLITNLGCTITSLSVPGKDGIYIYALHLCLFTKVFHFLGLWKCYWCFDSLDIEGKLADVVLGFDSVEPYLVKFCKPIWFWVTWWWSHDDEFGSGCIDFCRVGFVIIIIYFGGIKRKGLQFDDDVNFIHLCNLSSIHFMVLWLFDVGRKGIYLEKSYNLMIMWFLSTFFCNVI